MAPFHTWIRRAHYSTGGGGHGLVSNSAHENFLCQIKLYTRRCLWSVSLLFSCYTFCPFSALQIRSTRAHQHEKQMLKYRARTHAHACTRTHTKPSVQKTAAPANEDWISLVTSAVQIFPSVSIATATSHSLTEQSMTHRLVTNKNCNETLWQKAGLMLGLLQYSVQMNAIKQTDTAACMC